MPCQFDPLMKNCFDSVMKAILAVTVTLGSEVKVTRSDPKVPFQFPCVYGTYTEVPISEQVEELKMNKNWLTASFHLVVEHKKGCTGIKVCEKVFISQGTDQVVFLVLISRFLNKALVFKHYNLRQYYLQHYRLS